MIRAFGKIHVHCRKILNNLPFISPMNTTQTPPKTALEIVPKSENQKGIDNHLRAAAHFEAAAKSHQEAAKHHAAGDHEKAAKSTVEAHGHACVANEAQKEDVKHHTAKL